jgi:regulatory protein
VSELRQWLREREVPPEELDDVITRLLAAGLLDDARYALSFARSRLLDRRLSKRRVLAELARRGVARDLADAAVAQVMDDEGVDEFAAVEQVAARKWKTLAKLDRPVAIRRLMAFLARRGYDGDLVRRAVQAVSAG